MKQSLALGCGLALTAATAIQAEESSFKAYGFLDGQIQSTQTGASFTKQIFGAADYNIGLDNANLYLDWKPNSNIASLVEINFIGNKDYTSFGSNSLVELHLGGNKVSSDSAAYYLTAEYIRAKVLPSIPLPPMPPAMLKQVQDHLVDSLARIGSNQAQAKAGLAALTGALTSKGKDVTDTRQVTLERAQFDVKLSDELNFRFGQFITPAGIWNVDHASPVILTVRQPIQTTTVPIFPESQTGLMAYGRTYFGDNDLKYNLYMSRGRSGPSGGFATKFYNDLDSPADFAVGGHAGLHFDLFKSVDVGVSAFTGSLRQEKRENVYVFDVEEIAATPTGSIPRVQNMEINEIYPQNDREYVVGSDLKIEEFGATFQGEFNVRRVDAPTGNFDCYGFYGIISYLLPISKSLSATPYAMFEQVTWTGMKEAPAVMPDYGLRGFNSAIVGLNFGVFDNVRVKLEYNRFNLLKESESTMLPYGIDESDLKADFIATQLSVAF